ncbi:MAG: hypothetical protein ACI3V2_09030 [Faecousia sp.]
MEFIDANGHIVRSEVDVLLDVSQATSNRILKRMAADGLLSGGLREKNTV